MHRILSTLSILYVVSATTLNNGTIGKNFIYKSYSYNTKITIFVNSTTEQVMEFYEDTNLLEGFPTSVHVSTNDSVGVDNPLFITATQQKGISSWELPLLIQSNRRSWLINDMARTLCPHDAGPDIKTENRPTIHVTTSNPRNVTINITLTRVDDFYINLDKEVHLNVTPSTPKYYFFSFDQNPWNVTDVNSKISGLPLPCLNCTIPKSVVLMVDSDDEICATVSIQNNSCPVFDSESEVQYKGYYFSMSSKGGITLTQSMFPNGFYVVLVVQESDDMCTGGMVTGDTELTRNKSIRFRIVATVSYVEYLVGALVLVALLALLALFVLLAVPVFRCKFSEEVIVEEEPIIVPSTSGTSGTVEVSAEPKVAAENDDEGDEDESWSRSHPLTVHRLTRAPPEALAKRSDRYFWGALTLAVVYSLPVVQLLYTYQKMVLSTGDQDLCYYNFLCAHPLGSLSDFNHVYSNVGYIVLGLVFMCQVRHRQLASRRQPQDMGIPAHCGLQYSMGLALTMEGVLSACYHLCPNKMNFQFDSSFMYVLAVLVMLKLYQNRHSDILPSAHATFSLLALVMAIGLFGILFPSVYFSVFFTILYLGTCLVLTLKIYYAGKFKMELSAVSRGVNSLRSDGFKALVPVHRPRAVLIALANVANWSFAIYSLVVHNKDFARQLLAILMGNAILYTLFYIIMKCLHRERIPVYTWVYLLLAHVAWGVGLYLFLHSNTKWSQTPAQSRSHNAACAALHLFDAHDAWHVTSAAAMFLSLNVLLTVDDLLATTHRHIIHTF